jgi:hypothetical protein
MTNLKDISFIPHWCILMKAHAQNVSQFCRFNTGISIFSVLMKEHCKTADRS